MLTSLIRLPKPTHESPESPEDILNNTALTLFYPDAQRTFHGDPGSTVTYASKRYGDIKLRLADPEGRDERWLFAHHLWNSSVLLAELIGDEAARAGSEASSQKDDATSGEAQNGQSIGASNEVDENEKHDNHADLGLRAPGRWTVEGERVLELGAGTAVASIVSLLSNASTVFATDYPSPTIIDTLTHNLHSNLPSNLHSRLTISGHEWGTTTDRLTQGHAYSFTRIIACDTLWLDGEHEALAKSMRHFLSPEPHSRCWVVAGWHTGKRKVAAFFETARQRARLVPEWIGEVDTDFQVREWRPLGEGDAEVERERNRWMVVAVLKIAGKGES